MKYLLIFLISFPVYALEESDLEFIRSLEIKKPNVEEQTFKINKQDQIYMNTEVAPKDLNFTFLKKGTKIFLFDSEEVFYTKKDAHVYSYRILKEKNYAYIVNKKNLIKYKVLIESIHKIDDITVLYEKPLNFIEVAPKPKVRDPDVLRYESHFNYQIGAANGDYIREVVNEDFNGGLINRFEYSLVSDFDLSSQFSYPFQYGAFLRWSTLSGKSENTNIIGKSLILGPVFRKKFEDDVYYLKAGLALYADMSIDGELSTQVHKLSETSLNIGWHKNGHLFKFGYLTIGLNLQRKWPKITSERSNLNLSNSTFTEDSFAFTLGFSPRSFL